VTSFWVELWLVPIPTKHPTRHSQHGHQKPTEERKALIGFRLGDTGTGSGTLDLAKPPKEKD